MSASDWDEEANGPEPTQEQSDRLEILFRCGVPDFSVGPIAVTAAALGTEDEWAHTAIGYLKCMTSGDGGHSGGRAIMVSHAAISLLLGYVERLEIAAGIIPVPAGYSAGGASDA